MKRYQLQIAMYRADMVRTETGEWVEYEEVKELEELNREMEKTIKLILETQEGMLIASHKYYTIHTDLVRVIKDVLTKAEKGYDEWTNQLPGEEDWGGCK
jgi:hypothetical protein